MTDKTLGIIYAIKRSNKVWNQAVAEWMSDYSGSPVVAYTETVINKILKEAFVDYISTCDKPNVELYSFLCLIEGQGMHSLRYYIANILGMAQVKDGDIFVNGFRERMV